MTIALKKPVFTHNFLNETGEIFKSVTDLSDAAFKDAVRQLGPSASAFDGLNDFLVAYVFNNRDELKAILNFDFTPTIKTEPAGTEPVLGKLVPGTPPPAFTKPDVQVTEADLEAEAQKALGALGGK